MISTILERLSCGDAFGEHFFLPNAAAESAIRERAVPAPQWFFTDDTVLALSILEAGDPEIRKLNHCSTPISDLQFLCGLRLSFLSHVISQNVPG